MIPLTYQSNGNLTPGIHLITIEELNVEFGYTKKRRDLIKGLLKAIAALKDCNCSTIYIDGSFATNNIEYPNDYDACYVPQGMDLSKLVTNYPVFLDFKNRRENQKAIYKGELFSTTGIASPPKTLYLDFFQRCKNDGSPKGIIKINL